jgi:hypothetical protein
MLKVAETRDHVDNILHWYQGPVTLTRWWEKPNFRNVIWALFFVRDNCTHRNTHFGCKQQFHQWTQNTRCTSWGISTSLCPGDPGLFLSPETGYPVLSVVVSPLFIQTNVAIIPYILPCPFKFVIRYSPYRYTAGYIIWASAGPKVSC